MSCPPILEIQRSREASFRALIRCVSEVDALLSLAAASKAMGTSCRSELVANGETEPATVPWWYGSMDVTRQVAVWKGHGTWDPLF